jgi:DNA-binding XRE family transcriptional regulator
LENAGILQHHSPAFSVGLRFLKTAKEKETMKNKNNNETIGDKIKQLSNKQSLVQDELVIKSDLPYTTLTKIETNINTKPSIQTVMKIGKGVGISIDDLIR